MTSAGTVGQFPAAEQYCQIQVQAPTMSLGSRNLFFPKIENNLKNPSETKEVCYQKRL